MLVELREKGCFFSYANPEFLHVCQSALEEWLRVSLT